MTSLSGILVAGGRSKRMAGLDKARLFGEHAAGVLTTLCDDVVVASGDGRRLDWLGLPQVADAVADAGPLAGLVAGLQAVRHDLAAVLAVDLPEASGEVLAALAARWAGEAAVVPVVASRAQPLHAVWARSALGGLQARLDAGELSVTAAARAAGAVLAGVDVWGHLDATGGFARNVNAPGDL